MSRPARRTTPDERQLFGITTLSPKHPRMVDLRKRGDPSIHGQRPWSSTWLLIDYLERIGIDKTTRVIDAGCGWGFASCYCASQRGARVTALDADAEVFKFVREHARVNGCSGRVKTHAADFKRVPADILRDADILIGADICFWDELTDVLYGMIRRALRHGVKRVVIADPGRDPFEKLAEKCQREMRAILIDRTIRKPIYADGYILSIEGER